MPRVVLNALGPTQYSQSSVQNYSSYFNKETTVYLHAKYFTNIWKAFQIKNVFLRA